MNDNHFVGKPVLFTINNEPASIGEITDILKTNEGNRYRVREATDKVTKDGWNYYEISEEQIIKINHEKFKPVHEKWIVEHLTDINKAFGEDVSNHALVTYDTIEQAAEDGMEDFIKDEKFCHLVQGKWELLIG